MKGSYYPIAKEQIENGVQLFLKKVLSILDDAEILCENNGSESNTVSLYTIAVEEFGKYLLLKEYLNTKPDGSGCYKVNKSIFGKGRSHGEKFLKAIKTLPEVCIGYQRIGVYENENLYPFSYQQRILKLRQLIDKMKSPAARVSGTVQLEYDFEIRKNLLYIDWNEKINDWNKTLLKTDETERDDLVEELERELEADDTLDWAVEREIEKSEEEAEIELEDENLKVEDVDYKNVFRLSYPKNMIHAIKFFRKYINLEVINIG
jgi:AbiV family abortive infection protein